MGGVVDKIFDSIFKPKSAPKVPPKWTPPVIPARVDDTLQKVEQDPAVEAQRNAQKALGVKSLTIPLIKPNINQP